MTTTSAAEANDWQNPDVINSNPGGGPAFRAFSMKVMKCPSDDGHQTLLNTAYVGRTNWSRGNYAANAGPALWQESVNGTTVSKNVGGASFSAGGVMCLGWGATLTEVGNADGTSNTIIFTDIRNGGVLGNTDQRGAMFIGMPGCSVICGNAIDGSPTTAPNTGRDRLPRAVDNLTEGMGNQTGSVSDIAQARSRHNNGVNVCFADGNVRFIRNNVSQQVWFFMLSRGFVVLPSGGSNRLKPELRARIDSVPLGIVGPPPFNDLNAVAVRVGDEEAVGAGNLHRFLNGDAALLAMPPGRLAIGNAKREVPRAARIRLVL